MPALTCRDVDEVCDWFFRDKDVGKLILAAQIHGEEAHADIVKLWVEKFGPASYIERRLSYVRFDGE